MGAALSSSAANRSPVVSTSDRPQPGPVISDPTPDTRRDEWHSWPLPGARAIHLSDRAYLHLCDCRPGWEAKARPRARSSTHSSQRLVIARHASRFSGVRARPRTPVPERGRRTTTRVQSDATTRPRRRSLRSRPRGCRRPRALRWQPSARAQGLEPRGANGARRESAVPERCLRRRRPVVAARAIRLPVSRGAGWPRRRTAAP